MKKCLGYFPETGDFKIALVVFDGRNVEKINKQSHIIKLPDVYEHQFIWQDDLKRVKRFSGLCVFPAIPVFELERIIKKWKPKEAKQ